MEVGRVDRKSSRAGRAACALAALAVLLGAPANASAVTGGSLIEVSGTAAGVNQSPAIVAEGNGEFEVAWEHCDFQQLSCEVLARRVTASGELLGGEISVTGPITAQAINELRTPGPVIARSDNGGFTVAWESTPAGIYARRFDASGEALGEAIPVTAHGWTPAIGPDGDGGFDVAWEEEETSKAIYARRFDASGEALGEAITVSTIAEGSLYSPSIATSAGGGFTVVWERAKGFGESHAVARRFDASGEPLGGEIELWEATGERQESPVSAADSAGGFDAAWLAPGPGVDEDDIYVRRFDASGNALGPATHVGTAVADHPAIAADPGGGFTVAWRGEQSGSPGPQVYLKRFDASGSALSVAAPTESSPAFSQRAAIAPDGSGGVMVAWVREEGQGDRNVFARDFANVPETEIRTGPAGPTKYASPSFAFSSDEYNSSFECSFDGGGYSLCTSPFEPGSLADGPHSFEVRATNPEGATDLSPALRDFTVDTTPPDTSIDSGPDGPTQQTSATFAFSSEDPSARFKCSFDAGAASECTSPLTVGPLAEGFHSFRVWAYDEVGNTDPTPAERSFKVDTTPPVITFFEGPAEGSFTDEPDPRFVFKPSERGVSFECQIDGGSAAPCTSPFIAEALSDGPHLLFIRGIDEAGNEGTATRSFTVDTVPPETEIDSGPEGLIGERDPIFSFGSEEGASFECALDGGGYSPCTSPHTLGPLPDGPHSFAVRAVDEAGNADPSPASRSFSVDATPPETAIDSGPEGPTKDSTPSFALSSSEPGSSFECALDGGGFAPCSSPYTSAPLPEGPHSFAARARDAAGNLDPSPASRSFTVDTKPPSLRLRARPWKAAGAPIRLALRCSEECRAIVRGTVLMRRPGHRSARLALRPLSRELRARAQETLGLRLAGRGARRGLRRSLGPGVTARAGIALVVSDRAGNSRRARLGIALRDQAGRPLFHRSRLRHHRPRRGQRRRR
jgi:hypothetical protein